MEHYDSALAYPVQSPGVLGNQPDIVMDSLAVHGLGLVNPKKVFNFYNELHSYLASCGIDGVKVDVQNIIETLGAGLGGRVALTRSYHQALEASIARNFKDNGCISCMCHNTDGLYSAKQTAIVRASDDYYPRDPASHTIHIASVAYNTLFLGEFMQPDWDMFHVSKKQIAFRLYYIMQMLTLNVLLLPEFTPNGRVPRCSTFSRWMCNLCQVKKSLST